MSGEADKNRQLLAKAKRRYDQVMKEHATHGTDDGALREEAEKLRLTVQRLEAAVAQESKSKRRGAGGVDDGEEEEGLRGADMGSPVRKIVGTDGKLTVRAIASAYEKIGEDGKPVHKKRATKKAEEGAAAEEDLELEDDADLDLEDEELVLDDEELDLDDEAAPAGDDDDESLELSGDDLDLDADDGEGNVTGAVQHTGAEAGLTAGDLGADDDDESLDLSGDDLDLDADDDIVDDEEPAAAAEASAPAAAPATKKAEEAKPAAATTNKVVITRGEGLPVVTVQSHTLPNNKFLREPFRVIKVDEGALLGTSKKERIWDVDFFAKKFSNLDMAGYKSFSQPAANLFRVEKHVSDPRRLTLYFFDAPHPYDLILTSAERRNRFYELAMIQRRNAILWCPSLCPDGVNDAVVHVAGTTIMRPSGKLARVNGEGKMTVARMPYEIIDFWFGCISLQQKALPANFGMLSGFIPKGEHDLFIIGVADIPPQLVGKPDIGVFFSSYMGSAYHVLSQTIVESKDAPGKSCNGILVIVRRSFILRTSNIDAIEIDNIGKDGKKKSDYALVAAQVRVNESLICCCMINVSPNASQDALQRTGGIRALLNSITMGNEHLDFGCRYDYFIAAGNFGFPDAWGPADGLIAQNKNLLQTMKEPSPDASLKSKAGADPFRIFYEARQGTCRLDVKKYYSGANLPLNNAAITTDLYTLRTFLSTFGEYVPKVMFKLQNLNIISERLPTYTAGELHFTGEWLEGAPLSMHMARKGDGYMINEASVPPLKPVINHYDFLRLQHLQFTIMGFLPHVKTAKGKPKKIIIASANLPFKNLIEKGASKEFATPLIYRGCIVGSLVGNIKYEETA